MNSKPEYNVRIQDVIKPSKKDFTVMGLVGMSFGAFMLLLGITLIVTIIFFIPGMISFTFGMGIIHKSAPKVEVICDNCGTAGLYNDFKKNPKCVACDKPVLINWLSKRAYARKYKRLNS